MSKYVLWSATTTLLIMLYSTSYSQNWAKVGEGFSFQLGRLYVDDSTNTLFAHNVAYSGNSYVGPLAKLTPAGWDSVVIGGLRPEALYRYKNLLIYGSNPALAWNGFQFDTIATLGENGFIRGFSIYLGSLVAFGQFDSVNNIPAPNIAKWDGVTWSAFDTTRWFGVGIIVAKEYKDELYIGGNMWNYNGSLDRLARWNGTQWLPVGNGIIGGSAGVGSFEVFNNDLYIGGAFYTAQGNPANCVARWDGTQWKDAGQGMTSLNAGVYDLQVFQGELYACGQFSTVGNLPISRIAKWNGTEWCGLGVYDDWPSPGMTTMAVYDDELYVGGGFLTLNGDTLSYVARWTGGNFVDYCGAATSVTDLEAQNHLSLFPNPSTTTLHCSLTEPSPNTAAYVYATDGRLLIPNIPVTQTNFEIDISALPSGLYFLVVQSEKQRAMQRFVKTE